MRDKPWLSDLGYHHQPQRGFTVTAIIDLIGIVAVAVISIGAYCLIFGAH
jgi:hypothetical protein